MGKKEAEDGRVVKRKITIGAPAATAIGEEAIKEEEGEIQNKEALNALFNKIV